MTYLIWVGKLLIMDRAGSGSCLDVFVAIEKIILSVMRYVCSNFFATFYRYCPARLICLTAVLIDRSSMKGEARKILDSPLKIQRHLVQLLAISILLATAHRAQPVPFFTSNSCWQRLKEQILKMLPMEQ
jgi:hypothetical protein